MCIRDSCTCSGLTAPKENATWSIIYLGEIIPDRASRRLLLRLRNSTLLRSSDETNNSPWIFSKDSRISARAIGEENLNRRDPQFSNKSPINFFFGGLGMVGEKGGGEKRSSRFFGERGAVYQARFLPPARIYLYHRKSKLCLSIVNRQLDFFNPTFELSSFFFVLILRQFFEPRL